MQATIQAEAADTTLPFAGKPESGFWIRAFLERKIEKYIIFQ
jgi:hypothetical protein